MKKYLILAAIILAVAAAFGLQQKRINKLTVEREKYRNNTETLLQDIEEYKTKDSLNVAKVGNLELKLSEFKKYRAEDAKLIQSLKTKNRNLQSVTTAQMKTINRLQTSVHDSIIYLPGDTITTIIHKIDYSDKWIDFNGSIESGVFSGNIITRDSILIAETVRYKRFLFWRTRKIKNRNIDVVSRNPNAKIIGVEFITIEK